MVMNKEGSFDSNERFPLNLISHDFQVNKKMI